MSDIWVEIHTDSGETFKYSTEVSEGEALSETIDNLARGLENTGQFVWFTLEDGTNHILNKDRIAHMKVSGEAAE